MEILEWINENIVWGIPVLILFAGSGIIFTIRTRCLQVLHFPTIIKRTLLTKQPEADGKKVSPFRTLTAALGATVGTGNIIAIGSAIAFGGAGAIFWMWISALLGMATSFAENYLGAKYRTVQSDGLTGGVPFACHRLCGRFRVDARRHGVRRQKARCVLCGNVRCLLYRCQLRHRQYGSGEFGFDGASELSWSTSMGIGNSLCRSNCRNSTRRYPPP